MSTPETTLDRLTATAGQLYSLPAVAMQVLDLTNNPKVDARALKECIENDPALTGKLLRVVNSSLFGLSREVSDLNQALALLGTKPLKLLVLGFSLPSGLFAGIEGEILARYWRHTLTKAVAARELAETLWKMPGDDGFIAGLLQDLGLLLLIQELGEPYLNFLEKVYAAGKDLAAMESESMGFGHVELSARLLARWGLPEGLVEAVGWAARHGGSASPPPPDQPLAQLLHLAELFAQLLADGRSEVLAELLRLGRRSHDLSEEQLETLVGNLEEKVRQLADVLSLQLPNGLDYRDMLARAHAQLATVANEAAADLLRAQHIGGSTPEEERLSGELERLARAVAEVSSRPATVPRPAASETPGPQPPAVAPSRAAHAPSRPVPHGGAAAVATDPGLLGRLTAAVAGSRQARCPLSLLLVELDEADTAVISRGVDGFHRLLRELEAALSSVDHPSARCTPHGEAGYALILPDCERLAAAQLGTQLIDQFRRISTGGTLGGHQLASISVGVATVSLPPKNFPAEDLLHSADRCLYGSQASGGGVVKSIEIY